MTYAATVYRVLIASPSDVQTEREIIPQIIHEWNIQNSYDQGVVLLPVMWETHSVPEMGDRPQAIINKHLVNDCDFLIGMFWTKLGSDTGVAPSGTVEEIGELMSNGRPVLLYFSKQSVPQDKINPDQWNKLMDYKKECYKKGIVFDYADIEDLRKLLLRHLTLSMNRVKKDKEGLKVPPERNDLFMRELSDIKKEFKINWLSAKSQVSTSDFKDTLQLFESLKKSVIEIKVEYQDLLSDELNKKLDDLLSMLHGIYLLGYNNTALVTFTQKGNKIMEFVDAL